jgi:putative ABC transport system substrate-binding protein
MAIHIRRREFIFTLGGAAAAWPLGARAQHAAIPVVGSLFSQSAAPFAHRLRAFRQGLRQTGYVEGQNVVIEYRWAEGQYGRLPMLADELVRRQVAVIVAPGENATLAAKAATTTIPIVFAVAEDPVRHGLVASLARPGGNLTGINFFNAELVPKRLELLRELVPKASRVAVLVNPSNIASGERTEKEVEAAARAIGVQIQILNASTSREIDAAFAALARERADALFVAPDGFFNGRRVQLATMAARYAVPMTSATREIAEAGGLMSYGHNTADAWRELGVYAGRVLKGAKPAELPVVQPTKFELVINLKTARMLGLTVPPSLLALADEVIE